jgi:hypothetical protein
MPSDRKRMFGVDRFGPLLFFPAALVARLVSMYGSSARSE